MIEGLGLKKALTEILRRVEIVIDPKPGHNTPLSTVIFETKDRGHGYVVAWCDRSLLLVLFNTLSGETVWASAEYPMVEKDGVLAIRPRGTVKSWLYVRAADL
jgi:hypothetical protein